MPHGTWKGTKLSTASWKAREVSIRAWIQDLNDISGADKGQKRKHIFFGIAFIILVFVC